MHRLSLKQELQQLVREGSVISRCPYSCTASKASGQGLALYRGLGSARSDWAGLLPVPEHWTPALAAAEDTAWLTGALGRCSTPSCKNGLEENCILLSRECACFKISLYLGFFTEEIFFLCFVKFLLWSLNDLSTLAWVL